MVQLSKRLQGDEKSELGERILELADAIGSSLFTLFHIDSCLLFPARQNFADL